MLEVACELRDIYKAKVKFFVDEKALSILESNGFSSPEQVFLVEHPALLTEAGFETNYWKKVLDLIAKDEIVISDNIVKAISIRDNTILIANFFWHSVIELGSEDKKLLDNLLQKHKPTIIGHNLFSMSDVKGQKNFKPYGFRNETISDMRPKSGRSILIASGASGRAINEFKQHANNIKEICRKFENIYLDKYLKESLGPYFSNYTLATFTQEMYNSIDMAIIRPGLGTLRELYLRQIPMHLIFENNNLEMIHLSEKVSLLGLNAKVSSGLHYSNVQKTNILSEEIKYPSVTQNIIQAIKYDY